jgi:hypothetical protein
MPALAIIPKLFSCDHQLDEAHVGRMRETPATLAPEAMRKQIEDDGYLLLRGLLDPLKVLASRRKVLEQLDAAGHLDLSAPLMEGKFRPGADINCFRPELAQNDNTELQELLYAPDGELMQFFHRFLGGQVLHYDFTWLRCLANGPGTASHCDIVYMGRGTPRLFTAWVPLGTADFQTGGLCVLEGSHRNERLQQTYCKRDVDSYCENRTDDKALKSYGNNGWLSDDPNKIRRQLGNRWLVAEYEPGDMVVFGMNLVHGGLDNVSDRLRLSSDSRYQLASEPVDERWVGENPPGHSAAGKRGRVC